MCDLEETIRNNIKNVKYFTVIRALKKIQRVTILNDNQNITEEGIYSNIKLFKYRYGDRRPFKYTIQN